MARPSEVMTRRAFLSSLALFAATSRVAGPSVSFAAETVSSRLAAPETPLSGRTRPLLIAHNADSIELAAAAFAAGADIIEADIWDIDGELMVGHILGIGDWVIPSPIAEALFDPPTLETWLEALPAGAMAMFDIKGGDRSTTDRVAEALAASSKNASAFLCSPEWPYVRAAESSSNLTGIFTVRTTQEWEDVIPLIRKLESNHGLSMEKHVITPEIVSIAHELGAFVFAWTVNDVSEAEYLAELGVDGITTDLLTEVSAALFD